MGTTNLDDLLNQAEAQEASNDEWVLDSKYETKDFYVDEHGTVEIKNKTIGSMSSHISVKGESYSQYVEFKINRFYDGVDLTTMSLAIYYEIPNVGGDESRPINVYYNEMEIKFGWAVPSEITQNNLTMSLCIYFRGKLPDGKEYVLKTKPANYLIDNGLEFGSGIIPPTNNWYLNFVLEMDSKVNIATNAASQSLDSLNTVKDSESNVLQYKQVVEDKAETVNEQYLEVQTMHMETKNYRDEALQFRNEAEQFSPDGYSDLVEQVNKNTVAVNTIVEKADLGIKETASGEEIYLFDSSNGKPPEFYLFGKAKQNTTSGKNLLQNNATSKTINGLNFEVNKDKSVTVNGTHNLATAGTTSFNIFGTEAKNFMPNTNYSYSIYTSALGSSLVVLSKTNDGVVVAGNYKIVATVAAGADSIEFSLTQEDINSYPYLFAQIGVFYTVKTVENLTFYPMIRLASIEDDTYEPYTGGIPSPNPDYPQDIEVAGESYNLLENIATSQTINGVEFVVNEDKSVTVNGTASEISVLDNNITLDNGNYVLSIGRMPTSSVGVQLFKKSDNSIIVNAYTNDNVEFTVSEETEYVFRLRIASGTTVENATFYPMIRKASVKNDRYMPYGKGSVEVKSIGKNWLKNTYTSKTVYGVDFTVNNDKSVTLNGTADKSVAGGESTIGTVKLNKGKYILSGCPSGGSNETYRLIALINYEDGTTDTSWRTFGDEVEFNIQKEVREILVRTDIMSGYTANNLTFYPMIRLATEKDTTYKPYEETISTIPTTDFAGIKVSSGGNYTDSNGQQWICDEIVKYADGSGEKIQRIDFVDMGTLTWEYASPYFKTKDLVGVVKEPFDNKNYNHALSTCFVIENYDAMTVNNNGLTIVYSTSASHGQVWCKANDYTDLNSFKEMINGQYLYYELAEPITTPLTSEEIAEIEKLSTFYSVTNISNDFDCGMKMTYVVDAKNYIDNQLALQAKVREEEMMSMFLLLPEETQAAMIENDTNNLISGMEE